jgi:RNA polymerase sigma-70 factor (ECF subfamily)
MIADKANMVTDVQEEEVARLRARDAQAFRSLIERLQQPITGYLHRLVGEREVALDLAQDTFLQVYKEIGKTSLNLALDAWIYRIATNYGLQYLNRKRLRQFISFSFFVSSEYDGDNTNRTGTYEEGGVLHLSSKGPSIEDEAEMRILVEQALSLLKPKDAACLQLHYGNGFTYEQIGKIINLSPEAVRKRVARGVTKFREMYGNVPASYKAVADSVSKPASRKTRTMHER